MEGAKLFVCLFRFTGYSTGSALEKWVIDIHVLVAFDDFDFDNLVLL